MGCHFLLQWIFLFPLSPDQHSDSLSRCSADAVISKQHFSSEIQRILRKRNSWPGKQICIDKTAFESSMKFLDSQDKGFGFAFTANTLSYNMYASWFQRQHNKHIWYVFVWCHEIFCLLSKSMESTAKPHSTENGHVVHGVHKLLMWLYWEYRFCFYYCNFIAAVTMGSVNISQASSILEKMRNK